MTCQSAVDRWPACNRIRSLTGSGKEHMPLFDLDYMAHVPGEKSPGRKGGMDAVSINIDYDRE